MRLIRWVDLVKDAQSSEKALKRLEIQWRNDCN